MDNINWALSIFFFFLLQGGSKDGKVDLGEMEIERDQDSLYEISK